MASFRPVFRLAGERTNIGSGLSPGWRAAPGRRRGEHMQQAVYQRPGMAGDMRFKANEPATAFQIVLLDRSARRAYRSAFSLSVCNASSTIRSSEKRILISAG